jgi:regulator of sirC expression with transglutaminase-like and TPR domain
VSPAERPSEGDAPSERAALEAYLRGLAGQGDRPLDLAEAALVLAALQRPRVGIERYRHHLQLIARDVGAASADAGDVAGCAASLSQVLFGTYGYAGDQLTYDDLQNANLMRVIDRRKGLPVALGILAIHAGRAQGWAMSGLAFPGHFLIRLERRGERLVLDPFNRGRICGAAELRELLKSIGGTNAELDASHHADVSDREILLRLQNNIKLRLVQSGRPEPALEILGRMLLFAPEQAHLWQEAGMLNARLGNLRAGIAALEESLARERSHAARHHTALLLQQLKAELN